MEKIDAKSLKLVEIMPNLCPHISGTKCDRHKQIFYAERGGKSDLVAPYHRDQIGSSTAKMGVITTEPCLSMVIPSSPMKGLCIIL